MNLIVQPEAGLAPVLRAINRARQTLDVAIFRVDRKEIGKALAAAVQRGVRVRVLVANTNRGGEGRLRKLEQRLLDSGVTVTRTGTDFIRYHGKYLVADDTLHLFAFNFTMADTTKSRSFGVWTKDVKAVREALSVFEADCTRQPYVPKRSPLIVSPETAREALTAFLKGTRSQLLIYDVNVQDAAVIRILTSLASSGKDVRVIGKIKGKGPIECRAPRSMRLHARAIVRDGSRAFLGSQSLRRAELDQRREVGLIISNVAVSRKIRDVFEADWIDAGGKASDEEEAVSPRRLAVARGA